MIILINIVTNFIRSAKSTTLGLVKRKLLLNKADDIIYFSMTSPKTISPVTLIIL